jgi:hypothetical protein
VAHQVSIFLENKPGHLEKVTGVLREKRINIRAMTLATTTSGWGILNLLLDQPETGCASLCEAGFSAALREIVVAKMPDRPGGFHEMLGHLARAGINVRNAYATIIREEGQAILVIDVEEVDQARELLRSAGVETLSPDEIYRL